MKNENRKRILLILDILKKKSDETHPLSMKELIQHCFNHGINVERKTVYADIEILKEHGYDILFTRYKKQGYFLSENLFQVAELKILIDAVCASTFISNKKSHELINKLTSSTNIYEQELLQSQCYFPENKISNEKILYNIDTIQQAIIQNKEITFQYFDITVHKQKKYRKQAKRYTLIPYATLWENQRYYTIGYNTKYDCYQHYRVDKIDHIKIENTIEKITYFDLSTYTKKSLGIYSEEHNVILKCDLSLANEIFDQFGQNVLISEVTESSFTIQLILNVSPPLISWILQFKNKITAVSPQLLIDEIKDIAKTIQETY